MTKITEMTLIPLGVALISIGGGAAWLTRIHIQMDANAASIQSIEENQTEYSKDIRQIAVDIAEIKGELKRQRR